MSAHRFTQIYHAAAGWRRLAARDILAATVVVGIFLGACAWLL